MMKHPHSAHFLKAADDEIAAHAGSTWHLVNGGRKSLQPGTKIWDSMFQFKTKRDNEGVFQKFKARLCLRGDQADEVGDTHSPCVHAETVRLFLALAAAQDWEIHALDISMAFVHEKLPDGMTVVMRLPIPYTAGREVLVELDKSLYGLCEAPRIFYQGLSKHLVDRLAFTQSSFDQCIYIKRGADGRSLYALVHVDDVLIFAPRSPRNAAKVQHTLLLSQKSTTITAAHDDGDALSDLSPEAYRFKTGMEEKYKITWENEASSYTGYFIKRDREHLRLTISQPAYARHVVKEAGLEYSSPAPSPGDHIHFTGTSKGKGEPKRLRKLVGLLQYLTNTRVDILTELNRVSKTMNDPSCEDVQAAERIVRYISGTLDYGLTFSGTSTQLFAWADASFESERGGFSRSGIVFAIGENSGAFLAKSFTQHIRSLSTQESEIQALSEAARYVIFFRMILEEIGIPQERNVIYEDNNAAISFVKGESDFDRTKHISRHYRYSAQQYELGNIDVVRIDTKNQRADQVTKILTPSDHKSHSAINLNLSEIVS